MTIKGRKKSRSNMEAREQGSVGVASEPPWLKLAVTEAVGKGE